MPKPFLTYEQQLAKLRDEKHLVISDEESASNKLKRIGYYSLISGYKHLFRIPNQKNYKDGVSFDEIVALYEFDESLRELFLHYLLHIERHMRSLLSYYFTEKNGELQVSYLNKENYNYSRKHKNGIDRLVSELQKLAQTEQHPYIAYQRNKNFPSVNEKQLGQFLSVLTKFRNVCAHNERLFSYRCRDAIPDTKLHQKLDIPKKGDTYECGKTDLFAVVIAFRYLLPREEFILFKKKLTAQIDVILNSANHITRNELLSAMGFPQNWKDITKYKF